MLLKLTYDVLLHQYFILQLNSTLDKVTLGSHWKSVLLKQKTILIMTGILNALITYGLRTTHIDMYPYCRQGRLSLYLG